MSKMPEKMPTLTNLEAGMSTKIQGRIVFLDYMRVFAFMSVLIGHKFANNLTALISDSTTHTAIRFIAEITYPFCYGGAAGVVVFFLTSGYIITHVLQSEQPVEFLVKRIFRIYPLYIVAVVLEAFMWNHLNGAPPAPLSVWIPRLLLIGDFFATPHSLAGVEWTLRIEIMFYAFMAFLKALGAFNHQRKLPIIFTCSAVALYLLPEIPGKEIWVHGYFTIYAPFLFVGSIIYLVEAKKSGKLSCLASTAIILTLFSILISKLHPVWDNSHFATLALAVFLTAWLLGRKLPDGKFLRTSSDLTYSVYLFHNWIWLYYSNLVDEWGVKVVPQGVAVFIMLIATCYIAHKTVELQGVRLGRILLSTFSIKKTATPTHQIP